MFTGGNGQSMKCPVCSYHESKVVDSRPSSDFTTIRRRRECLSCQHRFKTYEVVDTIRTVVIKKDGTKELFDKNKLLVGLLKACEKRPVKAEVIANEIEAAVVNSLNREITSAAIGEMAMAKLRQADPVAYVRFASVYREFKDVDTFVREIEGLKSEK